MPTRLLCCLLLCLPALGQKLNDRDKPANHPVNCIYTGGDTEMLAKLGIVSIGGFEFGMEETTEELDGFLLATDVRWVETAHFKLGFALGPYRVAQKDKARLRAEIGEIAKVWPEVDPKMRTVDPWMRAYLFAVRLEKLYGTMQELLGVEDADFPDGTKVWDTTGKYMGHGPYLGQKHKYEVLILPSRQSSQDYIRNYFGLRHDRTQRWNMIEKETMQVVIPAADHLRDDKALHGHVVFNVTQMLVNGYRYYSYDMPVWLLEGMAHYYEREISPEFNSFDSSEGALAEVVNKDNWRPEVRKLVMKEEAPSMARLVGLQDFAGMKREDHLATWSMIDYLESEHPGFLGTLIDRLAGLLNDQFIPDKTGMPDEHRAAFKEDLKKSYSQFDRAWREWVLETYPSR